MLHLTNCPIKSLFVLPELETKANLKLVVPPYVNIAGSIDGSVWCILSLAAATSPNTYSVAFVWFFRTVHFQMWSQNAYILSRIDYICLMASPNMYSSVKRKCIFKDFLWHVLSMIGLYVSADFKTSNISWLLLWTKGHSLTKKCQSIIPVHK